MAWVRGDGFRRFSPGTCNLDPPTRIHPRVPAALRIACHHRCGRRRRTGGHSSDGSDCKYRRSFASSPAVHCLPCGRVPNGPQTDTGVGDPCSRQQAELIHDEQRVWAEAACLRASVSAVGVSIHVCACMCVCVGNTDWGGTRSNFGGWRQCPRILAAEMYLLIKLRKYNLILVHLNVCMNYTQKNSSQSKKEI